MKQELMKKCANCECEIDMEHGSHCYSKKLDVYFCHIECLMEYSMRTSGGKYGV